MKPEDKARQRIDQLFTQAGWLVQDYGAHNIAAGPGVAVREFPLTTGFADYLLYADAKVIGVAEAKKEGSTLREGLPNPIFTRGTPPAYLPSTSQLAEL
jgi:type I restriction enzyme, R subunit